MNRFNNMNDIEKLYRSEIYPSSNIRSSIAFSKSYIRKFNLQGTELNHRGCVNTVKWNVNGDKIITGSDDRIIKIWDTSKSMNDVKLVHEIRTKHTRNIFCAEMNPFNENIILSCAADGKVNIHDINNIHAEVSLERASLMHMLIYDIENPMIAYACEENGWVTRIDIRTNNIETIFRNYKKNRMHNWTPECVKAISQSSVHGSTQMVCGGKGFDFGLIDLRNNYKEIQSSRLFSELYVKTWSPTYKTHSYCNGESIVSTKLYQSEDSTIFHTSDVISVSGLQISKDGTELLVSYQGDQIYKFPYVNPHGDNMIGPSSCLGGHINFSTFLKTVAYFGPREEYVVSGSDSGHLWIWDSYSGSLENLSKPSERTCSVVNFLKSDEHCCNGVSPHPHLPILASYGIEKSAKLWGFNNDDGSEVNEVMKMKRAIYCSDLQILPLRLEDTQRKMRKFSIRKHTISEQIRRPIPVFDLNQFIGTVRSIRREFVECSDLKTISETNSIKLSMLESSGFWMPLNKVCVIDKEILPAFASDYLYDLNHGDLSFTDQDILDILHQIISDGDDVKKYYESLLLIQESAAKYKNPNGLILPNSEFSNLLALFRVAFISKACGNTEFKEKNYEQSLVYYRKVISYCRVIEGYINHGEYTCRQQFSYTRGEFMDYGLGDDSDDEAMEMGGWELDDDGNLTYNSFHDDEEDDDDDDDDDEDDDDDDDEDEDEDDNDDEEEDDVFNVDSGNEYDNIENIAAELNDLDNDSITSESNSNNKRQRLHNTDTDSSEKSSHMIEGSYEQLNEDETITNKLNDAKEEETILTPATYEKTTENMITPSFKKRALFPVISPDDKQQKSSFIAAFENVRELKEIVRKSSLDLCTTCMSNSIQSYICLQKYGTASIMCNILDEHCKEYNIDDDAKLKYRKGVVYMNVNKLKEAIECFTIAQKLSPNDNAIIQKLKEAKTKYENVRKKELRKYKNLFGNNDNDDEND